MPTWPESLPQTLLQPTYSEPRSSAIVETQVDAGPSLRRLRTSAQPQTLAGSQILTKAHCATLDAFYRDDLFFGVLSFDWQNPRTGESATMRFAKQNPYTITAKSGAQYSVSYNFEIMP